MVSGAYKRGYERSEIKTDEIRNSKLEIWEAAPFGHILYAFGGLPSNPGNPLVL